MLSPTINAGTFNGLTMKAWAVIAANGTITKSFNVASCTKGGTGNYTTIFTTAMTTATYCISIKFGGGAGSGTMSQATPSLLSTAQIGYAVTNSSGSAIDSAHYIEVWE